MTFTLAGHGLIECVGALAAVECGSCSVGKYKKLEDVECKDCLAGSYSAFAAASSCDDCLPGKYSEVYGVSSCTDCDVGKYSGRNASRNASNCVQCPALTSTLIKGSSQMDDCLCMPGYSGLVNSCIQCPKTKYKNTLGSECVNCPAGKYADTKGLTECVNCSIGRYVTTSNAELCNDICPPMSSTTSNGSSSKKDCLCNTGYTGDPFAFWGNPIVDFKCSGTCGCTNDDSCQYAKDGQCDEPGKSYQGNGWLYCQAGTDTSDCRKYGTSSSSGIITDVSGDYSASENCKWLISSTSEIRLYFTSFSTYSALDRVIINRCTSSDCVSPTEIARLSGSNVNLHNVYTSTTGHLQVLFETFSSHAGEGFSAKWEVVNSGCTLCPAGKYKGTDNVVPCLTCPLNTSSREGATDVKNCTCTAGYTGSDGGPCVSCPSSTYKILNGSSACLKCTDYSTSARGSTKSSDCVCDAGYMPSWVSDPGKCIACSVGMYKPNVSPAPSNPTSDTYVMDNWCHECPAGKYANRQTYIQLNTSQVTITFSNIYCYQQYQGTYSVAYIDSNGFPVYQRKGTGSLASTTFILSKTGDYWELYASGVKNVAAFVKDISRSLSPPINRPTVKNTGSGWQIMFQDNNWRERCYTGGQYVFFNTGIEVSSNEYLGNASTFCFNCEAGKYKHNPGYGVCLNCPVGTISIESDASACVNKTSITTPTPTTPALITTSSTTPVPNLDLLDNYGANLDLLDNYDADHDLLHDAGACGPLNDAGADSPTHCLPCWHCRTRRRQLHSMRGRHVCGIRQRVSVPQLLCGDVQGGRGLAKH